METFRKLVVWQKAHTLVLETYKVTKHFPTDERFGLVSQMRRAAVSIAANIVEGSKRTGLRDRQHFHAIADASLEELKYYFILSGDLGYMQQASVDTVFAIAREVGAMLHAFNAVVRNREQLQSKRSLWLYTSTALWLLSKFSSSVTLLGNLAAR